MDKRLLLSGIFGIAAALFLAGCVFQPASAPAQSLQGPIALSGVEILNYNGTRLTPSTDLPDNSIKGPQHVDITAYRLRIDGLVEHPAEYTYDQVLALPHYSKIVRLDCVEGWSATGLWTGVKVKDILDAAKPAQGARTVVFHAVDGYTSGFPIEYFTGNNGSNNIIMAFAMNNATLSEARGFPFMLVAESKWGYKWVKWIDRIEISSDTNYKGYWESRGYAQNGDRNQSFFG